MNFPGNKRVITLSFIFQSLESKSVETSQEHKENIFAKIFLAVLYNIILRDIEIKLMEGLSQFDMDKFFNSTHKIVATGLYACVGNEIQIPLSINKAYL